MNEARISWEQVNALAAALAIDVEIAGFKADMIIAIARGGLVPATILSHVLKVQRIISIQAIAYKDKVKLDKVEVLASLDLDIMNKNVLIVDDISDTGRSLKAVLSYVETRGAQTVKIATLLYKPKTEYIPDFVAMGTNKWVIFPWETEQK